jgi:signal transduction histidine kinase
MKWAGMSMLATISHDLRTPLTRIRLRGEFIEHREQQTRLFRESGRCTSSGPIAHRASVIAPRARFTHATKLVRE